MHEQRCRDRSIQSGWSKNAPRVLYSHPELCNDSVKLDPRLLKWTQPHTFVPLLGPSQREVGLVIDFIFSFFPPPSVPSDPKQIYDNVIVGTIVSIMAIHPARCSGTTRLAFGSRRSVLSLANNIIFYLINCHLNCTLKLSNSSKLTVEIDRVITSFEFSFDFFYQLLFSSFFENFLFQQGKTIS